MLYDYRKESKSPMLLTLANGKTIEGEFIDLRIATETLPKGKLWYHIRHTDDDWSEPASLKNGCVVVNFCGTFICDPIIDFPCGEELEDNRMVIPELTDIWQNGNVGQCSTLLCPCHLEIHIQWHQLL
jgi:hypothetical protein